MYICIQGPTYIQSAGIVVPHQVCMNSHCPPTEATATKAPTTEAPTTDAPTTERPPTEALVFTLSDFLVLICSPAKHKENG